MSLYFQVDVNTTDDGDLVLDNVGDIKTADPFRTVAQAINNILLTDKGALATDPRFGANLGAYIGDRNTPITRGLMESEIVREVEKQGLIYQNDMSVDVVPIEIDKVSVIVSIQGDFVNTVITGSNLGILRNANEDLTMAYLFPFTSGRIEQVT